MAAKADRVALEALRRSLVPAALPLVTGAEMAARYVPGRGVAGGDWYDVFTLPSGELSVVIGDVAGSGLPSASAQAVRLPRPVPSFTRSRGNATCLAGRKWAARNSPGGSARTSTRLPDPAAKPALPAG